MPLHLYRGQKKEFNTFKNLVIKGIVFDVDRVLRHKPTMVFDSTQFGSVSDLILIAKEIKEIIFIDLLLTKDEREALSWITEMGHNICKSLNYLGCPLKNETPVPIGFQVYYYGKEKSDPPRKTKIYYGSEIYGLHPHI